MNNKPPFERLPREKEVQALSDIHDGLNLTQVSDKLGFKNRNQFLAYRKYYADFNLEVDAARIAYCEALEEQLLDVHSRFSDPKMADVWSKNVQHVLKYRDPRRYGDKLNVDLTATVDISGSVDRAERRVIEAGITNVIQIAAKKDESE